jgi:hypothetical protein
VCARFSDKASRALPPCSLNDAIAGAFAEVTAPSRGLHPGSTSLKRQRAREVASTQPPKGRRFFEGPRDHHRFQAVARSA